MDKTDKKNEGRRRRGRVTRSRAGRDGSRLATTDTQSLDLRVGTAPGQVVVELDRPVRVIQLDVAAAFQLAKAIVDGATRAHNEQQRAAAGLAELRGGEIVGPDGRRVVPRAAPRRPRDADAAG